MKFTRLIFWQSIGLLFSEFMCSLHANNMWLERRPFSGSRQSIDEFVGESADKLVSELKNLGTDYMRSLKLMENMLTDMQDKWQDIDSKSKALKRMGHLLTNATPCNNDEDYDSGSEFRTEDVGSITKKIGKTELKSLAIGIKDIWERLDDIDWQVPDNEIPELSSQMAGLLFLLKERRCESPTETFYKDRCHPIGSSVHCPRDSLMVLYDGPNNKGFCDCRDNIRRRNGLLPIYSNETDKCYFQKKKGPCRSREWFVIKKKVSQCERIPNQCFDDGTYVYGKWIEQETSRSRWRNPRRK